MFASVGDFPDLHEMQDKLLTHDFTKFQPLKKPLLDAVDKMLAEDISKLMSMIPQVCVPNERSNGDAYCLMMLI